jgi:hypothetical protein
MPEELGKHRCGDEVWKGDVPMIVNINRLEEMASLGFSYADGRYLQVDISFVTAEGLVKDLELKLAEKGT